MSGITPKTKRTLKSIPRANNLRPVAGVFSAGSATIIALLIALGTFTSVAMTSIFHGVTIVFAWISVIYALIKLVSCALRPRQFRFRLSDDALPHYTVIVPLFHEAHMVPGLIKGLSRLNYPQHKLDIIFACEAIDPETVDVANRLSRPPFRVIVVPPVRPGGEPQTKPRALNYCLARSEGDLVTIYDAEDRPHPDQLRVAASAFVTHPDWVALQAPLDYYNGDDSLLAAQFALEYASLFHVQLPAYDRLGLPFPLGGTSNHIRRDALEQADGWDAFNVTEDADLAFRLAQGQRRIGWIAPPTREEAVSSLQPWFKQRSRWLKGYIQTWLSHMRAPLTGGWRRALMLQFTIGLSLLAIFFYAPVVLLLGVHVLTSLAGLHDQSLPHIYVGALSFASVCGMGAGAIGALRAGKPQLLLHVPFMPVYWALLFPPLIQALIEIRTNPFHWHKTEHGVSRTLKSAP